MSMLLCVACHPHPSSPDAGGGSAGTQGIVGIVWQLDQIQYGDDTLVKPDDPARYTLELTPDGNASVRADCNRGRGTFVLNGSSLSLKILAYTRAACLPESLDDRYRKALDQAASWMLRDGKLHIAMALDSGILSFAPAPR
jgi:para-nitrobenzyl esterase